jgi:hypothetical protein
MTSELKSTGSAPPDNRPPEKAPNWQITETDGNQIYVKDVANDKTIIVTNTNTKAGS